MDLSEEISMMPTVPELMLMLVPSNCLKITACSGLKVEALKLKSREVVLNTISKKGGPDGEKESMSSMVKRL